MDEHQTAEQVLSALGGKKNVLQNDICMTRLRIKLDNPDLVDRDALGAIASVLGTTRHGTNGIEVVFGPNVIDDVYRDFESLVSISQDLEASKSSPAQDAPRESRPEMEPGHRRSFSIQRKVAAERREAQLPPEDLDALRDMFAPEQGAAGAKRGRRVLVINGPNINMLGIREPETYGHEDFAALLQLCQDSAREAGFADCRCFQSNHEGDLVDEIQDAYRVFDGLVINPGAYTHTSVAILDAVRAVSIPTVEVHISKVEEREDFRQVSYIRQAAFETITGLGIQGYRKAIFDLWEHLQQR